MTFETLCGFVFYEMLNEELLNYARVVSSFTIYEILHNYESTIESSILFQRENYSHDFVFQWAIFNIKSNMQM